MDHISKTRKIGGKADTNTVPKTPPNWQLPYLLPELGKTLRHLLYSRSLAAPRCANDFPTEHIVKKLQVKSDVK